jgi:catechol 2,3-dioxygenase-like lactoylglutathione lyase family enzyme
LSEPQNAADLPVRLHHVGVVVANIETYLSRSLWQLDGAIVVDPIQQCRLCLTRVAPGIHTAIELVEPLHERSPTWAALDRGGGWHHVCLAVRSEEAGDELMHAQRLLPVTPWQPAALFGGRAVRFAYTRNRELVELFADGGPG